MPKKYLIRDGFTFTDGKTVLVGGETVELDDDVAKLHQHKLDNVPGAAVGAPKSRKSKADESPTTPTEPQADPAGANDQPEGDSAPVSDGVATAQGE